MPIKKFTEPEMTSVHSVKILLCYLLDRINRPVNAQQLHEIAMDSGVINHFYYSEALEALIEAGSVSRSGSGEEETICIEEKGRMGSEYFNKYIPPTFRRSILTAAYKLFSQIRHENEFKCEITDCGNGCMVNFTIKDVEYPLMQTALYAPDREQAELICERIKRNPSGFYSSIISLALDNPEEAPDIKL